MESKKDTTIDDDINIETFLKNENSILNKEYYKSIEKILKCSICLEIVYEPLQCQTCQNSFCKKCIENWRKQSNSNINCPFKCVNSNFVKSLIISQLLSGLKYKCKCEKEILYDDFQKHLDLECIKNNYQKKYINLKKEYDKIYDYFSKNSLFEKKQNEIVKNIYIKSNKHHHRLSIILRFKRGWVCDVCKKIFTDKIPSYYCSLCSFDLCYNCAKETLIEGEINPDMKQYYIGNSNAIQNLYWSNNRDFDYDSD